MTYHVQHTGESWFIAGATGEATVLDQSSEIRLWDDDYVLAAVEYTAPDDRTRGTYTLTVYPNMPEGSYSADDLTGWRDWRDALEFASGTTRDEWE